jgi:hypothetical protein
LGHASQLYIPHSISKLRVKSQLSPLDKIFPKPPKIGSVPSVPDFRPILTVVDGRSCRQALQEIFGEEVVGRVAHTLDRDFLDFQFQSQASMD